MRERPAAGHNACVSAWQGSSRRARFASGRSRVLAATLAIVAPVAALAIASPDPAPAGAPSAQLRPDLFTRAVHELYIDREAPELRFSNEIGNRGPGPLEIRPEGPTTDDCNHDGVLTNDAWVDQRIYGDDDGNGRFARRLDTSYDAVRAGCMFFHIAHNHWHFDDVARYELFRESDGRRVAAANKVSFCLIDTELLQPDTPGSPASPWYGVRTGSCASQTATEGISVGWADDYSAGLDGQSMSLKGIPTGRYCLISTADPDNQLAELHEHNNIRRNLIVIHRESRQAKRLQAPCKTGA